MPEWPQYQKDLAKWVKSILPSRVGTLDNAHGVAPGGAAATPWFSLRILSSNSTAPPERRTDADGSDQATTTIDRKRGTVSITLGEGAHYDDSDTLTSARTLPESVLLLESFDLAIIRHLSTVHLGSDSDGTTQNRSVVDFEFSYTVTRTSSSTEKALEATATGSYP